MRVHLEGMGVPGSILAWHLERNGYDWTWHDIDTPVCAWRACTGAVYPSGEPFDVANFKCWQHWFDGGAPWPRSLSDYALERTGWWYASKAPPHGARYAVAKDLGALRRSAQESFHFNAQRFVPETQAKFASRRRVIPPKGSRLAVTHGFGVRNQRVLWGWNARVKLELSKELWSAEPLVRPSIYCRKGRFIMAYAYAVPGEPWWYAGSSLISQKQPKELEVMSKYGRWKKNFEELAGGHARVVDIGEVSTGWRPAGDDSAPLVIRQDTTLLVRPFWNSGVRHAPLMVNAVLEALG